MVWIIRPAPNYPRKITRNSTVFLISKNPDSKVRHVGFVFVDYCGISATNSSHTSNFLSANLIQTVRSTFSSCFFFMSIITYKTSWEYSIQYNKGVPRTREGGGVRFQTLPSIPFISKFRTKF